MKKSILKTITLCLVILFTQVSSFAQEGFRQSSLDNATATAMLNNADGAIITKYLVEKGFKDSGPNPKGTARLTGTDVVGDVTFDVATQMFTNGTELVELTTIAISRKGARAETTTWAESGKEGEGQIYRVINGKVAAKAASTVTIEDCITYFNAASVNCKSCVSCIQNCVKSHSKGWAKLFCYAQCVGPCIKCGVNTYNFIKCIIQAIKG
jgi:hypothetical protein